MSEQRYLNSNYGWVFLLIVCGLLLGCSNTTASAPPEGLVRIQDLGSYAKHDVEVNVFLEKASDEQIYLTAEYIPLRPEFHLYSIDLPPNGINGAGRPTKLEIGSGSDLKVTEALFVDKPVLFLDIEGFDEPFPIYPDGPVTLRRPIEAENWTSITELDVSLTYMACSSQGRCLPPVVDEKLSFKIDSSSWLDQS